MGCFPYRREDVIVGAVDVAPVKDVDVIVLWQLDTRWLRGLTHVERLLLMFPFLVLSLWLPHIARFLQQQLIREYTNLILDTKQIDLGS